jgi:hypothetical protein
MRKFFEWLMKRKTKNISAGRPTIDDESLGAHRNIVGDMLSCWWGEVGWQLPRATTREKLREALEPLENHPDRHRINRLLLESSVSAKAEDIRAGRESNGHAIAKIYEAQEKQRTCMDLVNQAQMAVSQASPEQIKAVKAQVSKKLADLEEANLQHVTACKAQEDFQKNLDLMEAGFAQDELLMFINSRFIKGKYARNPENLANAIAGLPFAYGVYFTGVWQSYARCSKLDYPSHPQFQLFEIVESAWKKSQQSNRPLLEVFQQQVNTLPKNRTVKSIDPITGAEFEQKVENGLRSSLLRDWSIWRLAIEKTLDSSDERARIPFLVCANFTIVQRDPKTSVLLVLAAAEKAKN